MKMLNVNGFKLIYHKHSDNIINCRAVINAGSFDEKCQGTAHFLEHMFFTGTENYNSKDINRILEQIGDYNAYTSYDRTAFHISCLDYTFDDAVRMLCELLFKFKLDISEFNKEKSVIMEEIQTGLDDPWHFYFGEYMQSCLGDKAHLIAGTHEEFAKVTPEILMNFRKTNYVKDNMIFVIIGNIEEDKVVECCQKYFPNMSDEKVEIDHSCVFSNKEHCFNHVSEQAIMSLTCKGFGSLENITNPIENIFLNGFGGSSHSLMFNRIRDELGLCYDTGSLNLLQKDMGLMMFYVLLNKDNIEQAKREIISIAEDVKKNGFSKELLDTCKVNYLFNMLNSTRVSSSFASNFVDIYFKINGQIIDLEKRKEDVQKITNDDVVEFANKYLNNFKFVKMTKS